MKNVVSVSVGGREFSLEEDAYKRLDAYFRHFKSRLNMEQSSADEVMSDVEHRIAELFEQSTNGSSFRVVDLQMVESAIRELGMPDGASEPKDSENPSDSAGAADSKSKPGPDFSYDQQLGKGRRKLFRDMDHKAIAGVCSGLAAFTNVDTTIIRLITLVVCIFYGTGIVVYIVLWIVLPVAKTPYDKCLMHGYDPTAENMAKFAGSSDSGKQNEARKKKSTQ